MGIMYNQVNIKFKLNKMEEKMKEKTFFKRCKICRTISGFCLKENEIKKNKKYFCQECKKESKLNDLQSVTEKQYLIQQQNKISK